MSLATSMTLFSFSMPTEDKEVVDAAFRERFGWSAVGPAADVGLDGAEEEFGRLFTDILRLVVELPTNPPDASNSFFCKARGIYPVWDIFSQLDEDEDEVEKER